MRPTAAMFFVLACAGLTSTATAADFAVFVSPASQIVTQGQTTGYGVTILSTGGFTGVVALSLQNPVGTPSFSPTTVVVPPNAGAGSTLIIMTSNTTPTGTFGMTVVGTSGGISHAIPISITVNPPPNFTLSITPASQTVTQGQSATVQHDLAPGLNLPRFRKKTAA